MSGLSLPPEVIVASPVKTLLLFIGCFAFSTAALLIRATPDNRAWLWLGGVFFGLGCLIAVWMLIRPMSLVLDGEGFTLKGGMVRRENRIPWRDIESFFVYRGLPRGVQMIGFRYRPNRRPNPRIAAVVQAIVGGADGALPKGWPLNPQAMVDKLNAYRERALAAAPASLRAT